MLLGTDRRVLALAFARLADGIGNSFLIVVLPLYIGSEVVSGQTFGFTEPMIIGIVLSAFGFVSSLGQPFTGRLSDRTARRKVYLLLGLGILTVMNITYVFATSYVALVAIRLIQGIGVAFIVPASIALVNELATEGARGGNMGVYNTFRLIGFGSGPVVAGAVVNAGPYSIDRLVSGSSITITGFEAAFYVAAVTAALSFFLVTVLIHDPDDLTEAGDDLSIDVFDSDGTQLLDPVFTLGAATFFMATGIALFATLQPQVNELLDQSATWFGLQFAAFVFAQILLQAPIGRASDRWGRRPFLVVGLALLVPSTLAQGFAPTSETMFLARFIQGVAGAMVFAPALALAGDLAKTGESGTTLSVLTMAFGLGIAFGPLIAGFLVGFGFAVPFVFGAGLAAIGFGMVFTQVEETVGQEQSPGEPTPTD